MPLYEYQCQSCGRRLERIQKFSDPPLDTCPHCGGRLEKLISSPAFQFKGSGWYVTDYARKPDKAPATEGTSAKADGGSETKDTKPAAESTPKPDASATSKDSPKK